MQHENLSLLGKSEEETRKKSIEDFDAELGFLDSEVFSVEDYAHG